MISFAPQGGSNSPNGRLESILKGNTAKGDKGGKGDYLEGKFFVGLN